MIENLRKIQSDPYYYIDNKGNVYNSDLKILKDSICRGKTCSITLIKYINKKGEFITKTYSIARLVLEHFVRAPNDDETAINIDGDKLNNNVSNLIWRVCNRFNPNDDPNYQKGEIHSRAKLTDKDVLDIKKKLSEGILLHREIAKEYNISKSTISDIKNERTWSHLK